MQSFLSKCVDHIFKTYPEDISNLCFVLPNRRAALFLKKQMASHINKPLILPQIFSIEDFVAELSGLNIVDNLNLIFELYEIHKEIEGANAQEFDRFADWGFPLLKDFNDIDEYLINPEKLFDYLSEAKAVELWNPGQTHPSDFQKQYIRFYRSLLDYYNNLNKKLTAARSAYIGQAYRIIAETNVGTGVIQSWNKVLFMGFNALTTAEKTLIQKLIREDKADIYWDADHYYLQHDVNGSKQEAGYFLRKLFDERIFEKPSWIFDNFKEDQKNIHIIGVPQNIGQAKLCGKILKEEISGEDIHSNTAVVLAGESLLIPVLNSLPEEVERFNITMGFPLNQTPMYNLLQILINANLNLIRYEQIYGKSTGFYMRDVFSILRNPIITANSYNLFGLPAVELNRVIIRLVQTNKVFFSLSELKEFLTSKTGKFPEELFQHWNNNPDVALNSIVQFLKRLKESFANNPSEENNYRYELETEHLFYFSSIVRRIREINNKYRAITSLKTLQSLFRQIVKQTRLPFYGEPLSGLQIMGVLETRTLDFENLILLSANEGILPAAKTEVSFIPFDIKRRFGLPTYREREAVFAYHFYRLLQRSRNVFIVYNTEPGQLGGGDKSRFINQILHELPNYNDQIKIHESIYSNTIPTGSQESQISIPKNKEVMKMLNAKAEQGFSASALNRYRNCPLQFYLTSVLGIEEEEETEEVIESSTMGTIIHNILYELYKPFRNKPLQTDHLDKMKSQLKDLTEAVIQEEFKGGEIKYGKNYLLVNVIEELVKNHLNLQKEHLLEQGRQNQLLTVVELEKKIKVPFPFEQDIEDTKIYLSGFIDRIDQCSDEIHILDYKTGSVQSKDTSLGSIEDFEEKANDKSFQLLFYSWLYKNSSEKPPEQLKAGLIPLKRTQQLKQFLSVNKKVSISHEILDEFGRYLQQLFQEIFNPGLSFEQTRQSENCEYCTFKSICRK